MVALLSLALLLAAGVRAAPSPESLGSDITVLIDNDLQGSASPTADSGVTLLGARSYNESTAACQALGESLWSPELKTASIQPNLDYLKYKGASKNETRYWIASNGNLTRSINLSGQISWTSASTKLPALCTQSAPFSNDTAWDSSEKWQVTVKANNEYLIGFRDRYSFRFLGVRYAPEPARFTYSEPYLGEGGQVSALKYGSQCAQAYSGGSEDCLFVNIFTNYLPGPSSDKADLKPVMFWIHGGAFTSGTGNDPTVDGGNLASRGDVVVVDINYRLGTLGFLALADNKTNGNFGLADQINALDWVRNNIQNFGGDPDRITIFGQSAGAGSVRALMASPKSIGKFAGAIPLSGLGGIQYGTTYSLYYTIDQQLDAIGNAVLAATNCTNAESQVDCLRSLPVGTITGLSVNARFPVVDGTYLISNELSLNGPSLPLRLMMGIMRDDGGPILGYPSTTNATEFLTNGGFPIPPADVFPIPDIENKTTAVFNMSSRVATDGVFRCIDQATVYEGLRNDVFVPDVYYYEFNRSYQVGWPNLDVCEAPKSAAHPYGDPNGEYWKCHSGELYYVFGNLGRQGLPMRDENDLPFEQFILDSFASFGRTYNPNPDVEFLKARGYTNTLAELEGSGKWLPATKDGMTKRTLQWPSYQSPLDELEQCEWLGLGLDYYEK